MCVDPNRHSISTSIAPRWLVGLTCTHHREAEWLVSSAQLLTYLGTVREAEWRVSGENAQILRGRGLNYRMCKQANFSGVRYLTDQQLPYCCTHTKKICLFSLIFIFLFIYFGGLRTSYTTFEKKKKKTLQGHGKCFHRIYLLWLCVYIWCRIYSCSPRLLGSSKS